MKIAQKPDFLWSDRRQIQRGDKLPCIFRVPAVGDDGSGVRRVAGFDPAEEVEEGGGVLRHAVIRPRCELELTYFPPLAAATLRGKPRPDGLHTVSRLSFA